MNGAAERNARLREAASLLRVRAEGAIESLHGSRSWSGIGTGYREPIKEHIALMSPVVALAIATLLEREADSSERFTSGPLWEPLSIADAVLAEAAS